MLYAHISKNTFVCRIPYLYPPPLGQAWDALACPKDSDMPYREEVLHILHNTPEWIIQKKWWLTLASDNS